MKVLNIILWIVQGLLATMFLMAGGMKVFTPIEELSVKLPWVGEIPEMFVRAIGTTDLLAGIGVVLPLALRIKPKLTLWALWGIVATMLSAIVFHLSRGESSAIGMNIILTALACFVLWGRTKKIPISV